MILTCLDAVLRKRLHKPGNGLATIHKAHGDYAFFRKTPTEIGDSGNLVTFNAVDLTFQRSGNSLQGNLDSAGYLPSKKTASAWMNFAGPPN